MSMHGMTTKYHTLYLLINLYQDYPCIQWYSTSNWMLNKLYINDTIKKKIMMNNENYK